MKQLEITVKNDTGLHSRPADYFVRTCKLYKSKISVSFRGQTIDAKNILKVILLNICKDDSIIITAEGEDEDAALDDLRALIESDFRKVNGEVKI